MACCIVIVAVMSAALAIKYRLRGAKADSGTSALSWRLQAPGRQK
jgi:hypothetical protein